MKITHQEKLKFIEAERVEIDFKFTIEFAYESKESGVDEGENDIDYIYEGSLEKKIYTQEPFDKLF